MMFEFLKSWVKWGKYADWALYDLLEMTLLDLPGDFGVIKYPGIRDCVFIFNKNIFYAEDVKITFAELRDVCTNPKKWVDLVQEKLK